MKRFLSIWCITVLMGCSAPDEPNKLYTFQDSDTGLWGLKTSSGKIISKPQYTSVYATEGEDGGSYLSGPIYYVFKGGVFMALNHNGEKLFDAYWFDNGPDYFSEGLARFVENHKVGFHDAKGHKVIKATYDWATPFKKGKSIVCEGCYAEPAKTPRYYAASTYKRRYIYDRPYHVVKGGKWGAIDKCGNVIVCLSYNTLEEVNQALHQNKIG